MPKLPEKFEDWTPPWAEGEFDEDKAARLVFQTLKERDSYKEKNAAARSELDTVTEERDTLKDKVDGAGGKETEIQADLTAAKAKIRELEKASGASRPEDADRIARLEVAVEKKLTLAQAARLAGKDKDELTADADAYLREMGIDPDDTGEQEQESGSGRQPAYLQGLEGRIAGAGVRRREQLGNGRPDRKVGAPTLSAEQAVKDGDALFGEF